MMDLFRYEVVFLDEQTKKRRTVHLDAQNLDALEQLVKALYPVIYDVTKHYHRVISIVEVQFPAFLKE